MKGTLDNLSFREKSGYECSSISGSAQVGHGLASVTALNLSDKWSDINIPEFSMGYRTARDFKDFLEKIRLKAVIRDSRLDLRTLSYFVPGLDTAPFSIDIPETSLSGTVTDLEIASLEAGIKDFGVSLSLKGGISGLPEPEKTDIRITVGKLGFTTESVQDVLAALAPDNVPDISRYAPGQEFLFKGTINGELDGLGVSGALTSGIGSIMPDLKINGLTAGNSGMIIKGTLATKDFNIGKAIGSDLIQECDMKTGLKASFGSEGPKLEIDSLTVSRLNLNEYDYSGIAATGTLAQKAFNGKIICSDPNLNFLFQGLFNFSSKTRNALYNFYANIGYADLNALNIDKRGMSRISLQTSANFTRIKGNDLLGKIRIGSISLENESGKYDIGDILILHQRRQRPGAEKAASRHPQGFRICLERKQI